MERRMKLIITEKPKVSRKIAQAIAEKFSVHREHGVPYYEATENGDRVLIASAAGHLYSLKQALGEAGDYPVFHVEWAPIDEVDRSKTYTRKYIDLLKSLSANADEFYLATDYDIEGELLGYNVLRYACSATGKRIRRMKFSALTRVDLVRAFQEPMDVDLKLAAAGETRHILDWYWGINVSRALSKALRSANARAVMSAGRVQTPALAIVVAREREIRGFVAADFWEIIARLNAKGVEVNALHEKGRIFDKAEAERILEASKCSKALIDSVEIKEQRRPPPYPFDLGTLQRESWRLFGYTPKRTQQIAQDLYEGGYISYPRTSSQKLPPTIGYRRILEGLAASASFRSSASAVLAKDDLRPRQGVKSDPAHPAIYPTGTLPKRPSKPEEKIYKLVVHRFIATFGDPMMRELTSVRCLLNQEPFHFDGARTLAEGWLPLYPYISIRELALPKLASGDEVIVDKVFSRSDRTKPPERFNQSTIVKELEDRGLGTKATRADIVDTLFQREYVRGGVIEATELGLAVVEALEEYVPEIINEELTRSFENKIESIQRGEVEEEQVLEDARKELAKILDEFKGKEELIGPRLANGFAEKEKKKRTIGTCPKCGGELRIVRSRKTGKVFIGCSNYPKCTNSYPLPQMKGVRPTNKKCNVCGLPMISVPLGRGRVLSCIDMACRSKSKAK